MNDAFPRLLKVLALERKQGYRNKAVIGGLDKFASRWEADARAEASNPTAANEIVALLLGYPAVEDTVARERIIEQIIRRIKEAAPGLTTSLESGPEESNRAPLPQSTPKTAAPDAAEGAASQIAPDRRIPESPGAGERGPAADADLTPSAGPAPATIGGHGDLPPPVGGTGMPAQPGVEVGSALEGKDRERTAEPTLPARLKPLVTSAPEPAPLRPAPAATKPEPLPAEPPGQVKLDDNAGNIRDLAGKGLQPARPSDPPAPRNRSRDWGHPSHVCPA